MVRLVHMRMINFAKVVNLLFSVLDLNVKVVVVVSITGDVVVPVKV